MSKPTPAQIKAAREGARLSQSEAAALVHATRRTWQNWESSEGSGNYRAIDAAAWELFESKARRAAEAFERILAPAAIVRSAVVLGAQLRQGERAPVLVD